MTAAEAVLGCARALAFVREIPRNSNDGPGVRDMLALVGLGPGQPWCAAYVAYVGRTICGDTWPLPMTGGCAALGTAASARGMLTTTPTAGDIFLVWNEKLQRFAHTGFITRVHATGPHETIEGNTNDGGSRDGWGVFLRQRAFSPSDRFIHWQPAP